MLNGTYVRGLAVDVESITTGDAHGTLKGPFANAPVHLVLAPVVLSSDAAKLAVRYVPETNVMRSPISVVRAALSVAPVSRRWHPRLTTSPQRSSVHGHLRALGRIHLRVRAFFFADR